MTEVVKESEQSESECRGEEDEGEDGESVDTEEEMEQQIALSMDVSSKWSQCFNKEGFKIIDNFVYVICGDGCMQEGITSEACSLAGHLGLGRLVVLYDDNKIQIDGSTDLAFTEDVMKRYEAYGWQTIHVQDGDTDLVGPSRNARAPLGLRTPHPLHVPLC